VQDALARLPHAETLAAAPGRAPSRAPCGGPDCLVRGTRGGSTPEMFGMPLRGRQKEHRPDGTRTVKVR
jgi:hypothetical protein